MTWHGITEEMAKEFARDLLGTLKAKKMKNEFMFVENIAKIMGLTVEKAQDFCVVAAANKYMTKDGHKLPRYMNFPTLYKVWESNIE